VEGKNFTASYDSTNEYDRLKVMQIGSEIATQTGDQLGPTLQIVPQEPFQTPVTALTTAAAYHAEAQVDSYVATPEGNQYMQAIYGVAYSQQDEVARLIIGLEAQALTGTDNGVSLGLNGQIIRGQHFDAIPFNQWKQQFITRGQLAIYWNTAAGSKVLKAITGIALYVPTVEWDRLKLDQIAQEVGKGTYQGLELDGNAIVPTSLPQFNSLTDLELFLGWAAQLLNDKEFKAFYKIDQNYDPNDPYLPLFAENEVANFIGPGGFRQPQGPKPLRPDANISPQEYLKYLSEMDSMRIAIEGDRNLSMTINDGGLDFTRGYKDNAEQRSIDVQFLRDLVQLMGTLPEYPFKPGEAGRAQIVQMLRMAAKVQSDVDQYLQLEGPVQQKSSVAPARRSPDIQNQALSTKFPKQNTYQREILFTVAGEFAKRTVEVNGKEMNLLDLAQAIQPDIAALRRAGYQGPLQIETLGHVLKVFGLTNHLEHVRALREAISRYGIKDPGAVPYALPYEAVQTLKIMLFGFAEVQKYPEVRTGLPTGDPYSRFQASQVQRVDPVTGDEITETYNPFGIIQSKILKNPAHPGYVIRLDFDDLGFVVSKSVDTTEQKGRPLSTFKNLRIRSGEPAFAKLRALLIGTPLERQLNEGRFAEVIMTVEHDAVANRDHVRWYDLLGNLIVEEPGAQDLAVLVSDVGEDTERTSWVLWANGEKRAPSGKVTSVRPFFMNKPVASQTPAEREAAAFMGSLQQDDVRAAWDWAVVQDFVNDETTVQLFNGRAPPLEIIGQEHPGERGRAWSSVEINELANESKRHGFYLNDKTRLPRIINNPQDDGFVQYDPASLAEPQARPLSAGEVKKYDVSGNAVVETKDLTRHSTRVEGITPTGRTTSPVVGLEHTVVDAFGFPVYTENLKTHVRLKSYRMVTPQDFVDPRNPQDPTGLEGFRAELARLGIPYQPGRDYNLMPVGLMRAFDLTKTGNPDQAWSYLEYYSHGLMQFRITEAHGTREVLRPTYDEAGIEIRFDTEVFSGGLRTERRVLDNLWWEQDGTMHGTETKYAVLPDGREVRMSGHTSYIREAGLDKALLTTGSLRDNDEFTLIERDGRGRETKRQNYVVDKDAPRLNTDKGGTTLADLKKLIAEGKAKLNGGSSRPTYHSDGTFSVPAWTALHTVAGEKRIESTRHFVLGRMWHEQVEDMDTEYSLDTAYLKPIAMTDTRIKQGDPRVQTFRSELDDLDIRGNELVGIKVHGTDLRTNLQWTDYTNLAGRPGENWNSTTSLETVQSRRPDGSLASLNLEVTATTRPGMPSGPFNERTTNQTLYTSILGQEIVNSTLLDKGLIRHDNTATGLQSLEQKDGNDFQIKTATLNAKRNTITFPAYALVNGKPIGATTGSHTYNRHNPARNLFLETEAGVQRRGQALVSEAQITQRYANGGFDAKVRDLFFNQNLRPEGAEDAVVHSSSLGRPVTSTNAMYKSFMDPRRSIVTPLGGADFGKRYTQGNDQVEDYVLTFNAQPGQPPLSSWQIKVNEVREHKEHTENYTAADGMMDSHLPLPDGELVTRPKYENDLKVGADVEFVSSTDGHRAPRHEDRHVGWDPARNAPKVEHVDIAPTQPTWVYSPRSSDQLAASTPWDALIQQMSNEYGVDARMIQSIMQHESTYDPYAVSEAGAMGLMQLMPTTAKQWGVTNPFDTAQNIRGGTRYLAYLQELFHDDAGNPLWERILQGYVAGPDTDISTLTIQWQEYVAQYVQDVLHLYQGEVSNDRVVLKTPSTYVRYHHEIRTIQFGDVVHTESGSRATNLDPDAHTARAQDARSGEPDVDSAVNVTNKNRTDANYLDHRTGRPTITAYNQASNLDNAGDVRSAVISQGAPKGRFVYMPDEQVEYIMQDDVEVGQVVSRGGRVVRIYSSYDYEHNQRHVTLIRQDPLTKLPLKETYVETKDADGRVALEERTVDVYSNSQRVTRHFGLQIAYDGASIRRTTPALRYEDHREPVREYRYHEPIAFSRIGVNLTANDMDKLHALIGLTPETLVLPMDVKMIWGEEYTEYAVAEDPMGRVFLRVYKDGTKRIVDKFTEDTNFPSKWHLLDANNDPGHHYFSPVFSEFPAWVYDAYMALLRLESDPKLLEPGIAAAVYPLDNTSPQYLTYKQINDLGPYVAPIIRLPDAEAVKEYKDATGLDRKIGDWVPVVWDKAPDPSTGEVIDGWWYETRTSAKTPVRFKVSYDTNSTPHGRIDDQLQVTGIVEYSPSAPNKPSVGSLLPAPARRKLQDADIQKSMQWAEQTLNSGHSYVVPTLADAVLANIDPKNPNLQAEVRDLKSNYDVAQGVILNVIEGTPAAQAAAKAKLEEFRNKVASQSNLPKEQAPRTGEVVWIGIAAAQYAHKFGLSDGVARDVMNQVIRYIQDHQSVDASKPLEYGGVPIAGPGSEFSVEHNLDVLSFLTMAVKLLPSTGALHNQLIAMRGMSAKWMLISGYDRAHARMYRGQGQNKANTATDVQAWGVLVLKGIQQMDADFYKDSGLSGIDLEGLLQWSENWTRDDENFTRPDGRTVQVKGLFRFSNETVNKKKAPVSVEWSLQMALAYQALGHADRYNEILKEIDDKVRNGDGSVPYALTHGWVYNNGSVATIFRSVTGSAYWVRASLAFNDFILGGGTTFSGMPTARPLPVPAGQSGVPGRAAPAPAPVGQAIPAQPEVLGKPVPPAQKAPQKQEVKPPEILKPPEGAGHAELTIPSHPEAQPEQRGLLAWIKKNFLPITAYAASPEVQQQAQQTLGTQRIGSFLRSFTIPRETDPELAALRSTAQNEIRGMMNTYDLAQSIIFDVARNDRQAAADGLSIYAGGVIPQSSKEWRSRMGEVVWMGMAAAQYAQQYGFSDGIAEKTIQTVNAYIRQLQVTDRSDSAFGAVRQTMTARNETSNPSTEHNLDVLAYLTMLSNLGWHAGSRESADMNRIRGEVAHWVRHFGYKEAEKRMNRGHKDGANVTDVQAWGVLVLKAVQQMDRAFFDTNDLGRIDLRGLLNYADAHTRIKAPVRYVKPDGTVVIINDGYRFSDESVKGKLSPVSVEWTLQMAMAFQAMGTPADIARANRLIDEMNKTRSDGSLPYALEHGWTYNNGWIATKFGAFISNAHSLLAQLGREEGQVVNYFSLFPKGQRKDLGNIPKTDLTKISQVGIQQTHEEMLAALPMEQYRKLSYGMPPAPFPEQLRKVRLDANGIPEVKPDWDTRTTRVVYENAVTGVITADTLRGSTLVMREIYEDGVKSQDNLQWVVFYGEGGEDEPFFRLKFEKREANKPQDIHVDEVYGKLRLDGANKVTRKYGIPLSTPLDVHGIQLQGVKREALVALIPALVGQYQDLLKLAEAISGVVTTETTYEITPEKYPRKIRESVLVPNEAAGNLEMDTEFYYYDKNDKNSGRESGLLSQAKTTIIKGAERREKAALTTDYRYGRMSWYRNGSGSEMFPKKFRDLLGLKPGDDNPWVVESRISSSWGARWSEFRRQGDARVIMFQQALTRRLNYGFDGEYPKISLLLNIENSDMGSSELLEGKEGFIGAGELFGPYEEKYREGTKDQAHPQGRNIWDDLARLGIIHDAEHPDRDTRIPKVRLKNAQIEGSESLGTLHYVPASTKMSYLYMNPFDPLGREFARESSEKDMEIVFWWLEGETSQTRVGDPLKPEEKPVLAPVYHPFGVPPETLTIHKNGTFSQMVAKPSLLPGSKTEMSHKPQPVEAPSEMTDVYGRKIDWVEAVSFLQNTLPKLLRQPALDQLMGIRGSAAYTAKGRNDLTSLLRWFQDHTADLRRPGQDEEPNQEVIHKLERALQLLEPITRELTYRAEPMWHSNAIVRPDLEETVHALSYIGTLKLYLQLHRAQSYGLYLYVYHFWTTNFKGAKIEVANTPDGSTFAEGFRHGLADPFHNLGTSPTIGFPSVWLGLERIYYDTSVNRRRPMVSMEEEVTSEVPGKTARKAERFYADLVYKIRQGKEEPIQEIESYSEEMEARANPDDKSKVFPQWTLIRDGESVDKKRPDIPESWLPWGSTSARQGWKAFFIEIAGAAILFVWFDILIAFSRWARDRSERLRNRLRGRVRPSTGPSPVPSVDKTEIPPPAPPESSTDVKAFIGRIKSMPDYGLPWYCVNVTKDRLAARLEKQLMAGGTIKQLFDIELDYYQNDWVHYVLEDKEQIPWMQSGNKEPLNNVTDEKYLEYLYLWFLSFQLAANFRNEMAFHSYIFHESLLKNGEVLEPGETKKEREEKIGKWMKDQAKRWHTIIYSNMKLRGKGSQEDYLNYDDVQGLFRSPRFIKAYRDNNDIVPQNSLTPEWKTYLEKSRPVTPEATLRGLQPLPIRTAIFGASLVLASKLVLLYGFSITVFSWPAVVILMVIMGVSFALGTRRLMSSPRWPALAERLQGKIDLMLRVLGPVAGILAVVLGVMFYVGTVAYSNIPALSVYLTAIFLIATVGLAFLAWSFQPVTKSRTWLAIGSRGWRTVILNHWWLVVGFFSTLYPFFLHMLEKAAANSNFAHALTSFGLLKGEIVLMGALIVAWTVLYLTVRRPRPEPPAGSKASEVKPWEDSVPLMFSTRLIQHKEIWKAMGKQLLVNIGFWALIFAAKGTWNWKVFGWIQWPVAQILHHGAHFIGAGPAAYLLPALVGIFIIYYFLDTFSFLYFFEALIGKFYAQIFLRVGRVKTWSQMRRRHNDAREEFYKKLLPESVENRLSRRQKQVAWAQVWNAIIDNMREEDVLEAWKDRNKADPYKWIIDGAVPGDFLSGHAEKPDDFLIYEPVNKDVRERLPFFINSLFMEMRRAPDYAHSYSRTIEIPTLDEDTVVSIEQLFSRLDTGGTVLTRLDDKYSDEWDNFVYRMERSGTFSPADIVELQNLIGTLRSLGPGDPTPSPISNGDLRWEVQFWASNRLQTLARTVRGVMRQRSAQILLTQIEFPQVDAGKAAELVDQQWQFLLGHQNHASFKANDPRLDGILEIMKRNPTLEMSFVIQVRPGAQDREAEVITQMQEYANEDLQSGWYAVLTRIGDDGKPAIIGLEERPGTPIKDMGEGKPEHQASLLGFARGEKIETMDMNQDIDFEEALKFNNLLEEFRDESVKIVSMPETIYTIGFSNEGSNAGESDDSFNGPVKTILALLGIHMHYGHPDWHDTAWVTTRGGVSNQNEVNEDIFNGYGTVMQGGRIIYRQFVRVKKGREVGVAPSAGMFTKFGMGALQQAYSRFLYWWNNFWYVPKMLLRTSRAAMRQGDMRLALLAVALIIPLWPLQILRMLSHFFAALGFYIRKVPVKHANTLYLLLITLIQVTGFVAFPNEVHVGLIGIALSQIISVVGLAHLMTQKGVFKGVGFWMRLMTVGMMVPFFQFHIYTNASGAEDALISRARYIATGRGHELLHRDAGALYRQFRSSHIHHGILVLIMIVIPAIHLWRSPAFIWSFFPILQIFSAIFVAFLMNRGGTPLGSAKEPVSLSTWLTLWLRDFRYFLAQDMASRGAPGGFDSFYPGDFDVWKAREVLRNIADQQLQNHDPIQSAYLPLAMKAPYVIEKLSAADLADFFNSLLINGPSDEKKDYRNLILKNTEQTQIPEPNWGRFEFLRRRFQNWNNAISARLGILPLRNDRRKVINLFKTAYPDVFNHGFISWSIGLYWRGMYLFSWFFTLLPVLFVGAYVAPARPHSGSVVVNIGEGRETRVFFRLPRRVGENIWRVAFSLLPTGILLWATSFLWTGFHWPVIALGVMVLVLMPYILMILRMTPEDRQEWADFGGLIAAGLRGILPFLRDQAAYLRRQMSRRQRGSAILVFMISVSLALNVGKEHPHLAMILLVTHLMTAVGLIVAGVAIIWQANQRRRRAAGPPLTPPVDEAQTLEGRVKSGEAGVEAANEYRIAFQRVVARRGASEEVVQLTGRINEIQDAIVEEFANDPLNNWVVQTMRANISDVRKESEGIRLHPRRDRNLIAAVQNLVNLSTRIQAGMVIRIIQPAISAPSPHPWRDRLRRFWPSGGRGGTSAVLILLVLPHQDALRLLAACVVLIAIWLSYQSDLVQAALAAGRRRVSAAA
jgi:hypothetical protein